MNSELESVFAQDPPAVVLGELEVMTLGDEDIARAAILLEEEHDLGAARPVGRTLFQAVHHRGRWVALLMWGPAALKLTDRDAEIGWTDRQRAERIGLIVQNRRFLVLAKTRMPNLASRALSLAVNALPAAWEQTHSYRPLLAETFTDIEAFEGTCYKAAAWQPCGITKGFTREHRADYFFRNDRPKKLWLRVLHRNAGPMLCGIEMPPQYAAGLNLNTPERALPLRANQLESLRDVLREVPDPRASNRKFPCSSLLLLVAMGLLAGRKSLASIQRYGQFLTQKQRATLGWPSNKLGTFRPAPSYAALYNLLCKIDPHGFAAALNGWLAAAHGTLPRGLAIDGKYVRNLVLTLCLSEHESGAPAAIAIAEQAPVNEETKKEGELTCARRLYATTPLHGATVTGDALHCEAQSITLVVENGGDALFQLKANQPNALKHAMEVAAKHSPLLPANPTNSTTAARNGGFTGSIR
ncbi:MAG: DUF4338 domain-containing protein [Akkermansiaceae bacterium]|jgi:hypothetical protein|nr:DUF4338 domain-containing protein [Akkermansiaceae bacterium]